MRVKEETERASLKLNTKKINIMTSGSITSWQIEGEKVEVFTEFLFLGSTITVDGDCCHDIRRLLLLVRKTMTNLNSVLKCRDIILPTKFHIVKAMVFPMVTYGCESWMWRRWCVEELMSSNYGAGENSWVSFGNQPWIFIARTDAEVKTPVFWSSDANSWLIQKVPDAKKDWAGRRRRHQRMRWLNDITNVMDMNLGKLRKMMRDRITKYFAHTYLNCCGQNEGKRLTWHTKFSPSLDENLAKVGSIR